MTKSILFISIFLLFVSISQTNREEYAYPNNSNISAADGKPLDSLTFYFPTLIKIDTTISETGMNTFVQNWFSSALYSAKEPILYNFYLGHDVYRFLWLRSFHKPVIFSLEKREEKIWLTTKVLNKQPDFMKIAHYIRFAPPLSSRKKREGKTLDFNNEEFKIDSISIPDRKADIILNEVKQLSEKEWNEFEAILNDFSFWKAKPYIESSGVDGSEWTIEGHFKNKYWFVTRWTPKGDFRKAGLYLIRKSGLKEDSY